jgi:hypothetical protein
MAIAAVRSSPGSSGRLDHRFFDEDTKGRADYIRTESQLLVSPVIVNWLFADFQLTIVPFLRRLTIGALLLTLMDRLVS